VQDSLYFYDIFAFDGVWPFEHIYWHSGTSAGPKNLFNFNEASPETSKGTLQIPCRCRLSDGSLCYFFSVKITGCLVFHRYIIFAR